MVVRWVRRGTLAVGHMESSVTSLFDRFADGIYTLAVRVVRDRHLAEDVVQETFLTILRGRAPYRGDGSLAGWVYRIGYRQAVTALRRRRELPTEDEILERQADRVVDGPDGAVLQRELAERIDAAISQLSPPLRAAFVLRDVEELSVAETALALGVGESAVKMRVMRARGELREMLKGYLHESRL